MSVLCEVLSYNSGEKAGKAVRCKHCVPDYNEYYGVYLSGGFLAPGSYEHFSDSATVLFGYSQQARDSTGSLYVGERSYEAVITARSFTDIHPDLGLGIWVRSVQKFTMHVALSPHTESATRL